jgi:hypothetical protein
MNPVRSFLAVPLLAAALWTGTAQAQAKAPAVAAEAYEGFTLDLLAECWARHGDFKTRFGDKQGPVEFGKYLQTRGLSSERFWRAYQLWYERFQADKSGKLMAEWALKEAQWSGKLNFGDVPDLSQTAKEGVTLDTYARIAAAMIKPGAKPEEIVRANGLKDMAHWERANKAWSDAMAQDTSFRLTSQYGELFQKHAGPAWQKEQQQKLAEALAEGNKPRPARDDDGDEADLSPETLHSQLSSKNRDERWEAARWLGLKCDADMVNKKDAAMMKRCEAAVPVLIDTLEHHDDETVGRAEGAADQLMDMVGGRTEDARYAMQVCLSRARERLETLRLAFAPIQNKAVPERVTMSTRIQEYESLVRALDTHLKAWKKK